MSDGACCHYCRRYNCVCPQEENVVKTPHEIALEVIQACGIDYPQSKLVVVAKAYLDLEAENAALRAEAESLRKCPHCVEGITGTDCYGEACECYICDGNGRLELERYAEYVHNFKATAGDLQADQFQLGLVEKERDALRAELTAFKDAYAGSKPIAMEGA